MTQAESREVQAVLPDGTPYHIHVPRNWDGVLVRDLDFASRVVGPVSSMVYADLFRQGIAVAGTARHRLRMYQYDPVREIGNLDRVLDIVSAEFGRPSKVIQFGCSGGGHVTLAVSEAFHERVDGAVALAAHTPIWLMNTFLDGWFALKTLLTPGYVAAGLGRAEDLQIYDLPNDGSVDLSAHGRGGDLPEAWRRAIDEAQRTSLGRARIALAFTVGQWPAWVNDKTPRPDLGDAEAVQISMYHAAYQNAANPGGEARVMFENAAQGQQLSWNTDVDYRSMFENGNPSFRKVVEALYRESGASYEADLDLINSSPRVEGSQYAREFWSKPGRTILGKPRIPVLRLHMIGDYQIPCSLMQGYEDLVAANGAIDLARTLYVEATGHCNFTPAETTGAVRLVLDRIARGVWPDTAPDSVNAFAKSFGTGSEPRFIDATAVRQEKYMRAWLPH